MARRKTLWYNGINKHGRELSLSALGVNWIVGGNSVRKISSPKGTLFVTILSFSLAVTLLQSTTY
jgi:hypothetical protein